ncbi:aldose 1-epimerase [Paenibacillus sp. CC-CFT747]|nr:aldose 1-epimerase [Paenibacillus sp. CC-CFT747]
MSRYEVVWLKREGDLVCRLKDFQSEAEAELIPALGMNVIRYAVREKEVILPPPYLTALRQTPFRYGIPVLSPPGRTSFGRFTYQGVSCQLPLNTGMHNVHGELGALPWKVISWEAEEGEGACLQACYAYRKDSERFAYFPFELIYTVTYSLKEGALQLEGAVQNTGDRYAPFSLGYHPYFTCDRSRTSLQLPASLEWPRSPRGIGGTLPLSTKLAAQLHEGVELAGLKESLHYFQCRDNGLERDRAYVCRLHDKGSGREIHFQVDGLFSVMVLFLPPWGRPFLWNRIPVFRIPTIFRGQLPRQAPWSWLPGRETIRLANRS